MTDILERTTRGMLDLEISSDFRFKQEYYKEAVSFTKEHHARIVLATSMASPSVIDMAGITTGACLMLSTDREIKVGIDTSTNLITLAANGMIMLVGSFSAVYVQNESADYEATIEVVITD